jgi:ATP-dependent DNA helicase RecQ
MPELDALKACIARHWGFRTLRPLQEQGMRAVLDGRDSLMVLPTGGGKSLCYQAPAVVRGDTTVVVSPLISLMKDQVDSLQGCGVPAVQIDSSQTPAEQADHRRAIEEGDVRLLFVSPERLVLTDFCQLLKRVNVRTFAIDEAHCISHWGHDFRPEYRQLNRLRDHFPGSSIHAYTATATERVRRDIIEQLALRDPAVLVGNFDRANLTYRVLARQDWLKQVLEVLDRHPREAGIIYCIRRIDVDDLTSRLQKLGYKALAYHAGLTPEERKATHNAFAKEDCDIVVATVAFGMGIDRSNIRFVLHTAMPKSIEHYQQETGRAGRDGLEAECVLLYSGADFMSWKGIMEKSAAEPGVDPSYLPAAVQHLNDMDRYCRGAVCRHKALVQYFGQDYPAQSCAACDLCLGDTEEVPDATIVAQKILSCVARVQERFGIGHVVSVVRGENTEAVRRWRHEQLSTYGLLADHSKADVRDWIYQLLGQGVLWQEELALASGNKAAILKLNAGSWEVMRGQRTVRLVQPVRRRKGEGPEKSKAAAVSWEGVDAELFDALRELRRKLADERHVPPYIIFSDATLRELARVRPSSLEQMRLVYGIGDAKLRELGAVFLQVIEQQCRQRSLSRDNAASPVRAAEPPTGPSRPNRQRQRAFELFGKGATIEKVMHETGRARSTVCEYLAEFIRENAPSDITTWVSPKIYNQVAATARTVGSDRLKPIFIALDEQVPYEEIRLVISHLQAKQAPAAEPRR